MSNKKIVGVDFGINPFVITSDGKKFHINRIPDLLYTSEHGGSTIEIFAEYANTDKEKIKDLKDIERIKEIIETQAEIIRPIIFEVIEYLTNFDVIAIEDIQIEGMHFESEMSILGYPENVKIIQNELISRNKKVHLVNMKSTSRKCSHCGFHVRNEKNKPKPIKLNLFKCQNDGCPLSHCWIDKDINAAMNIRNEVLHHYLSEDEILEYLGLV